MSQDKKILHSKQKTNASYSACVKVSVFDNTSYSFSQTGFNLILKLIKIIELEWLICVSMLTKC